MPAGKVEARPTDGRAPWLNSEPDAVAAASSALGADIVIDYEHQGEFSKFNGKPAPAAGWIKRVFARRGEVWGEVEWTARAAEMIKAREYRYISPVFDHTRASRVVKRITGAALVNDPALYMRAIARANANQEETMDLAKLRKALNLADDAGDDAILQAAAKAVKAGGVADTALAGLKAVAKAAGLGDDATAADIETAVAKARSGGDPDPARFVPREEYDKAVARVTSIETERATEKATAAVDAAVKAGKVSPGQREWAEAYAKRDAEDFAEFVKNAPAILTAGARAQPGTGTDTVSSFRSPDGRPVDEGRMSIHEKALARARADKISYEQAAIIEEEAAA